VIGNPRAGRGKVTAGWEDVRAAFAGHGVEIETAQTERPGHAADLAMQARRDRVELVVAFGGDGTVHEVVNGVLAPSAIDEIPMLGVLPAGSGCDYAKTFGIPEDVEGAIAHLIRSEPRPVDVGEITFTGDDGSPRRLFANISEVGIGAEVVDRARRMPRFLRGGVYLAGFLLTFPMFRTKRAWIEANDDAYDGPLTNLVVANAQVFGGGMRIAPKADPSDGAFDIQIQFGSKIDYVRVVSKSYKGTHLPHPGIKELRASRLTVRCDPPTLIEADGEVLGHTPATFSILPGALLIKA
jgi:diacylglycerol kinase (ATP)